jgi:4-diphosphocytidyl-2-C-methyl-D-erythritol kinase
MTLLTAAAPAKLNLHLRVLDRRQDGFHNLESVFLALDFGDTLHFEPLDGKNALEIDMEWDSRLAGKTDFAIPIEKNIIFKALSLFREKTGFSDGLKIKVEKRIPSGGGLGGGSSDAAAVLLALNKLSGGPLSRAALLETAAVLGSDVPFFVYETPAAMITGRGECIEPLEAPRLFFVLVNPGFPSDTAAAFRLLDEYRERRKGEFTAEFRGVAQSFTEEDVLCDPAKWLFRNDFLPVFKKPEKSVYEEIISQLRKLGADFAGLSGAGSTCFGVFKNRACAERAVVSLRDTALLRDTASLREDGKRSFVECAAGRV